MIGGLILLAAQVATPAAAPAPVAAQAAAVDPARLKAAQALVDQVMPPAQREAMMRAIVTPMLGNMRQAMMANPDFAKMAASDPRVSEAVQHFAEKMIADSMADVGRDMPKLMDAMAIAYARQFSVQQLDEVRAFYMSPTGRAFMSRLPEIMADPAVVQAQGAMMRAQMERMPARVKELTAEITKLEAEKRGAAK